MSANTVVATDAAFEKMIEKGVTLVDFWAEWCGPCRMIAPALETIAGKTAGKVKIVKLNVDENPNVAGQYGIMSIPTLLVFKDGKIADRKVGAAPPAALETWVNGQI
jgi:thioredoxin 1